MKIRKGKIMIRYTNEFLTDGDITIERVANRLKLISEGIKNSNKLNLCYLRRNFWKNSKYIIWI